MNRKKFKQRTFAETLDLLCRAKGGDFLRAGKINQSEVARKAGVKQPNLSRWMNGLEPKSEGIKKVAKVFGVTPAQMRGELPVEKIDGIVSVISDADREYYDIVEDAPEWMKKSFRAQVEAYYASQSDDQETSGQ